MAQYGRPSSDVATGDWVEAPLYAKVDEAVASDADYIAAVGTTHCELGLSTMAAPAAGDVTIRVRYRKAAGAADSTLTATLVEGTTVIATEEFAVTSETWTTGSFVLTSGEKAAITNWGNLRVRLDYAEAAEASTLLGVGSASDSLTTYPKTGSVTVGDWYVDPNAVTNGVGTIGDPFDNLASALSAVSDGETILVRAGTITPTSTFSRGTSWTTGINVFNYGTERPVISMTSMGTSRFLSMSGAREHWKGFEFVDANGGIVLITGSHYTIEDCWAHRVALTTSPGGIFYIYGHTNTGNVFQDCAIWRIGDGSSTDTNTPDGFKMHADYGTSTQYASGHTWVRCFCAHAPDDGYDMFYGNGNSVIDSVVYKAGYYWNGTRAADATGFKLGSNNTNIGNNTIRGSIAVACGNVGINSNFAPEPIDVINCTSTQDDFRGIRAPIAGSDVRNNIEYDNGNTPETVTGSYNTWNDPADAGGNTDFPITNPSFAGIVSYDWSLDTGSPAIGAGDTGGNLGASTIALEIAKEWIAKDLTT